jgi:hypothetical protein
VTVDLLLHPTPDLVDRSGAELDHVGRVQDRGGVLELLRPATDTRCTMTSTPTETAMGDDAEQPERDEDEKPKAGITSTKSVLAIRISGLAEGAWLVVIADLAPERGRPAGKGWRSGSATPR